VIAMILDNCPPEVTADPRPKATTKGKLSFY